MLLISRHFSTGISNILMASKANECVYDCKDVTEACDTYIAIEAISFKLAPDSSTPPCPDGAGLPEVYCS